MPGPEEDAPTGVEVPVFYANHVLANVSTNDWTLVFHQVLPPRNPGDKERLVRPQCVVYLSPIQAKALRDLLDHQIKDYEETHQVELPSTFSEKRPKGRTIAKKAKKANGRGRASV